MLLSRIGPKRKAVQWLSTLLLIGIPFVRVGGESLVRLDASSRTLLFFGARVRIEEFHLFLIAVLILVFGFLFVTMVFGRVWCGWLCPQTTVTDLADFLDRKIDAFLPGRLCGTVKQIMYFLISCTVAANLVWYFIPPWEFFPRLVGGGIGTVAGVTLFSTALVLYLDLVLVRRRFCTAVCPYGRIQLMTMDRNTLTLEFDRSLEEACIQCGACMKACPMRIDIKDGLQIECINCGRCIDACRYVMEKRSGQGLIHYTFGVRGEGRGRPLNARSLLLAGVLVLLCAIMAAGIATRQQATIKVQRGGEGRVARLADGALANFFSAYLENRSTVPADYTITTQPVAGYRLELLGPVTNLHLAANANRRVDFIVKITPPPARDQEIRVQLLKDGKIMATAVARVSVK